MLTTDLGAYVPRPESERVAEALQVSLLVGRRIIALTGPRGIGKTMLLHVVSRRLQRAFRAVYLPFAALPAPELCALILDVLGLPSGDDPQADLLAATARLERASRTLVVMIDDASALSLAAARRLAQVVSEANGSLRLILVPEDDFQSGRTLAALGDDLDEVRFGVPMTVEETARYLRLRLEWARASQGTRQRFNRAAVERLHALSGGLPGLLNELARAVVRRGVGALDPGAAASAAAHEEALGLDEPVLDEPVLEVAAPEAEPEPPSEPEAAAAPVGAAPEIVAETEVVAVGGAEDVAVADAEAQHQPAPAPAPAPAAPEPAAEPAPAGDAMSLEVHEAAPEEPPPREDEGLVAATAALSASEEPRAPGPISEADLYADDVGSGGDDDLPAPVAPRPGSSAPLSRHLFAAGASAAAVIELPDAVSRATSPEREVERAALPTAAVNGPAPAHRPLPPAVRPVPRAAKLSAGPIRWDDEDRAEEALAALLGVEEEDDTSPQRWRDDVEDFDPGAERLLPGSRGARTDAPPSWKGFVSAVLVVGLLIAGLPWVRSWLQPGPTASPAGPVAVEGSDGPGAEEAERAEASAAGTEAAAGPRPDPQAQAPVNVEVRAETAATVEVDGVYLGATPLKDVPLLPGEHVFRTRFADGRVVEQRIQVGPDSRRIDLVPKRAVVDRARR